MPPLRTRSSRLAAMVTWLLALVLLGRASQAGSTAAALLGLFLALGALLGGTRMWFRNCFESHLVVSMTVVAVVAGTVLELTIGMPGHPKTSIGPTQLVLLGLSLAVAALLMMDARARRTDQSRRSPYAL